MIPRTFITFVEKYMIQMKYKGFMRALLSTMRNGMLGDFSPVYRKVGKQGTPTLLFWGRDDKTVIPLPIVDHIRAAIRKLSSMSLITVDISRMVRKAGTGKPTAVGVLEMKKSEIRTIYQYNAWANARILNVPQN